MKKRFFILRKEKNMFNPENNIIDKDNLTINAINGPIIFINGLTTLQMGEMVYVGNENLVGEVIGLSSDKTTIQVYEDTSGLKLGEKIIASGDNVYVTLGPGMLSNIYDGIERPLDIIAQNNGHYINRGVNVTSLNETKLWNLKITASVGDYVEGGSIIGEVMESPSINHKIMIPPNLNGDIIWIINNGDYNVNEVIAKLQDKNGNTHEITMKQKWPIRVPRPIMKREQITTPLITGQRIIDTLFPIGKGGTACVPGGFGTGKTMTQHQIAKWANADIIVYIGCGERGNEMTQVLKDFAKLEDPKTGNMLLDRTILIANTSNMPVAAREASIYTGITIAEYYRDMGLDVAIMADSTSRWAEALRELSGRLEEMPAEEGFPAYLASRLSDFYERAGYVKTLNNNYGSVSIIGAVSPQGGDFSEPVTSNTKRFVRCFWGLDRSLAYARHFPAIHWLSSYSEYIDDLSLWYNTNAGSNFIEYRKQIIAILNKENSLMEIVKLIGSDVLPDDQKLILEIAKVIRVGFLQQNAFHSEDTCVPIEKQYMMMHVILHLYDTCSKLISMNMPMSILKEFDIFDKIISIKYDVPNNKVDAIKDYIRLIDEFYNNVLAKNA